MIRRKGKSTRKLLNIRDRNAKRAKFLLYILQFLLLTFSLMHNVANINEKDFLTYIAIIITTMFTTFIVDKITKGDNTLLLIVNMLFTIGVSMVYRLNPEAGRKQLLFYLMGIIVFFTVYFTLRVFKNWEKLFLLYFLINIALFAFTLIKGEWIGGAKNWVNIAGVSIQPSEIIKIPFAFFIASFYTRYGEFTKKFKFLGRLFMTVGIYIFIGLFFIQRELGTAVVFFAVMIMTQFVYEKDYKLIAINTVLMLLGLIFAYFVMEHVRVRFNIWIDPWSDPENKGHQIVQSLIAISSGKLFGSGIGLGYPERIPVAQSDFIFAAVIEEMGIFTGIAILLLFLLLVYKGYQIGYNQTNKFYSILAFVISSIFAIQSLIIIGGVIKLIPLTGIVLPFMSSGGSAMISGFIMLACLQRAMDPIKEIDDEKK